MGLWTTGERMTYQRRGTVSDYRSSEEKTLRSQGGFTEEKGLPLGLEAKYSSVTGGELLGRVFKRGETRPPGLEQGRK